MMAGMPARGRPKTPLLLAISTGEDRYRDIVKSCGLAGDRRVAFSGRRARFDGVAEGRVSARERDQAVVTAAAPAARRAGSARRRSGR